MSLINQMLRDLETRHSRGSGEDMEEVDRAALRGGHGYAPTRRSRGNRRTVLGVSAIALLACGAGAGWYISQRINPQQATMPPTVQVHAEPAEHIQVPPPPGATTQDTPGIVEPPESPGPKDAPSALHSAPVQTTPAKQKTGREDGVDSPPASRTATGARKHALQPAPPQETSTPASQPRHTGNVAISHASDALEQRRKVLHDAQQHYHAGDYPATIAVLLQYLTRDPHPQPEAGAAASEIISLDARIYRRLALAQLRLGRTAAAADTLEQGHIRTPEDVELHMLYARVQLELNNGDRAYNILRHMPQPQIAAHPDFYALRAALAREHGSYTEAVELYSLLCRLDPHRGDWRLGLAISQHQQGSLEMAYQNYQRVAADSALDAKLRDYASRQAQQLFSHE